ncbi:acetyl-CoA C-acetyltransferase [Mariniluteicoccus endophyticus]
MAKAYIVDALRTPVGRRGKGLAQVHPIDLGAAPIRALLERYEDRVGGSALVDEVIYGCIDQLGPQSFDVARQCWLAAGGAEDVPATTIDRQCGSGQQAVHYAAQAVMSGTSDLVVAGGVQSMSAVPLSSAYAAGEHFGFPDPFSGSQGWTARYGDEEISQFRGAEMLAERYDLSREELEALSAESHRRALHAQEQGWFADEIVPLAGVEADEGPRTPDLAKMATLPTIREGGRLTAATASQMSDGAGALLIASEAAVERYGLEPMARIHHISARGSDPVVMLDAPIPATRYALERAGMSLDDMDHIEINEAFASVVLAWQRELEPDMAKVNPYGGAMALGHPIGATGARLMTTLVHALVRTGKRYGLQTMCEGGGQANVTIVENLRR